MLALRPNCENCNVDLPPESTNARICSFECTFCTECVEKVLSNVCPNCGGGFCQRPNRPKTKWKGDAYLGKHQARIERLHRPVDPIQHAKFSENLKQVRPEDR
jgi:hypothetical protein